MLTCFHLTTINFFVQIHDQFLEHLVRDQLKLSSGDFEVLVDFNAALFRDDEVLSALRY